MEWNIVLKLGALGVCIILALQVVFYFVFQIIEYNSFWLGVTLIASILVFIVILILIRALENAITKQTS
jgi:uncharacterized membrane protein